MVFYCTHHWWPILQTYLIFVRQVILYILRFLMAFSVHIPPNVDLISISPTSSWPCLYTRDFYGLFCIFTSPWWAYVYIFYVCTPALSWWPILYKVNIFVPYLFLWAILYIYFSLVSLSLLGKYFMTTCTSFWSPILYTHTYHEDLYSCDFHGLFHLFLLGELIFTYFMVILCWPILNTYFYLGDLFCTYGCFSRLILYSYFPMF